MADSAVVASPTQADFNPLGFELVLQTGTYRAVSHYKRVGGHAKPVDDDDDDEVEADPFAPFVWRIVRWVRHVCLCTRGRGGIHAYPRWLLAVDSNRLTWLEVRSLDEEERPVYPRPGIPSSFLGHATATVAFGVPA